MEHKLKHEDFSRTNQLLYDKEFRKNLCNDPNKYISKLGIQLADNQVAKVVKKTKNISYIVMPDFYGKIESGELSNIQAAGSASTAGTAGSASTMFCFPACMSSMTSASSAGSGGTKG
ncbi:hypothetical protein SPONL_501 [uncultured Candidatus Thioglobus sp.]|nr:hypothetical protein SPONL_501 [uncultured Candidatus Thioglobus sp.]